MKIEDKQMLDIRFNPSGDKLAVSGENKIRIVKAPAWDTIKIQDFPSHEKPISVIDWIHDQIIITGSLDNTIKISNVDSKTILHEFKVDNFLKSVQYSSRLRMVDFYDFEGNLGIWKNDLLGESEDDQAKAVAKKAKIKKPEIRTSEDVHMETENHGLSPEPSSEKKPDSQVNYHMMEYNQDFGDTDMKDISR